MFGRVLTIALNTYREAVRARILLGLAGVAFCVSAFSLVIASFTLNSAPRVVSDLGVPIEPRVRVIRYQSADQQRRCERLKSVDELLDRLVNRCGVLRQAR